MQQDDATVSLDAAQRSAASAGRKWLVPVGEGHRRPFLDYVLSALADAGCTEAILVVPPDHACLRDRYAAPDVSRLAVHFAVQPGASGTAQAVLAAEPEIGGRPFLVLNSDNLYPVEVLRALAALDGPGLPAFERARPGRGQRLSGGARRPVRGARRGRSRLADRHSREAGRGRSGLARCRRVDQHEPLALRRAHLPGVPRRAAVGTRRVRAAGGGGAWRSLAASAFE